MNWIPALSDGKIYPFSLSGVLENADSIKRIACASPLEEYAILRLLVALKASGEPIQPEIFALDGATPFMQTADASGRSQPISRLTPDVPTGSATVFWQHDKLDADGKFYCAACIARALVALTPWTTVGGAGLSPSINGAPPVYWMPRGKNLQETIKLCNLSGLTGFIPWSRTPGEYGEHTHVSLLHGLTWLPRKVHVLWQYGNFTCTRCGQACTMGASEASYSQGEKCLDETWRDPFVAYRKKSGKAVRPFGDERNDWAGFCDWATINDDVALPEFITGDYTAYGLHTELGKMKTFDWFRVDGSLPTEVGVGPVAASYEVLRTAVAIGSYGRD